MAPRLVRAGSWVVGPSPGPFTYSNWGGIEPNNSIPFSYAYMNIGVSFAETLLRISAMSWK